MNRKNWTGFFMGMVAWILMTQFVHADVKVTNIEVKPRYPWNGLVDIVYSVTCGEKDRNGDDYEIRVDFVGYDQDQDREIQLRTLTGQGVNEPVMSGGPYKVTWNAAKDYPTINSSKFKVKIHACIPLYMVVDLTGKNSLGGYSVRYTGEAPNLDDDTCRTTELWLRRIPAGKFMMGSPEDELGHQSNETLHEVTITKPFYIGIFELTQKQANLIRGKTDFGNKGDTRPADNISHDGYINYISTLTSKTGVTFDFPTEAEWEYACRAGTSTSLNSGKNLNTLNETDENLNEVGRNHGNKSDGKGGYTTHTKVGSYKPNAWGLYDMHGNVFEIVKDTSGGYYGREAVEDPYYYSGSTVFYVIRGGAWKSITNDSSIQNAQLRSAYRNSASYNTCYLGSGNYISYVLGFRIACRP